MSRFAALHGQFEALQAKLAGAGVETFTWPEMGADDFGWAKTETRKRFIEAIRRQDMPAADSLIPDIIRETAP